MSGRVLIVGAGGAGRVAAHKCAGAPDVFGAVCLASRRRERCEVIAGEVSREIVTAEVDADCVSELGELLGWFRPDVVINLALPYQDLAIMEACLGAGVSYVDTANYEPRDRARFEYGWQWAYGDRFRERGITGLLGCGFDPGVVNAFCAYAVKHLFDRVDWVDIFDCNAGEHGHFFATNFNPEINIREVTARGRFWEDGVWREVEALGVSRDFDYPGVGVRRSYLMYHEEIESLCRNIRGVRRIRFWMAFSERYLSCLEVFRGVGLTRIDPVEFEGGSIVPLQFLKALLPDPAGLGARTRGRTCIGCLVEGLRGGRRRRVFIFNGCDHEACFREVNAQAVSYTTGVPAVVGAMLVLQGVWGRPGVFNVEELDPDPFLGVLGDWGLPWEVEERDVAGSDG